MAGSFLDFSLKAGPGQIAWLDALVHSRAQKAPSQGTDVRSAGETGLRLRTERDFFFFYSFTCLYQYNLIVSYFIQ